MIYKPQKNNARNTFAEVKKILIKVENLIIVECEDADIIICKETGAVISNKHKEEFFKLITDLTTIYWKLIDNQNLGYQTKKLVSFCNKAYPEAKYSFDMIHKAYRFIERRVSRCYALITNPEQTKLFLIRNHSPNGSPVGFGLPGGKTEFNESYEACLKRELYEEIGVKINESDLKDFIEFSHYHRNIRVYKIVLPEEEYTPNNSYEIEEASWFFIANLPKLVIVATHSLKHFISSSYRCSCDLCKKKCKPSVNYINHQIPIPV